MNNRYCLKCKWYEVIGEEDCIHPNSFADSVMSKRGKRVHHRQSWNKDNTCHNFTEKNYLLQKWYGTTDEQVFNHYMIRVLIGNFIFIGIVFLIMFYFMPLEK